MAKPVSLTEKFGGLFSPEVQARGELAWEVRPLEAGDLWFSAEVVLAAEKEFWTSRLDVIRGQLCAECECPAGLRGELCEHLWALLRKAEEFGDLGAARKRSVSGKRIDTGTEDLDDDHDDDDWVGRIEEEEAGIVPFPKYRKPSAEALAAILEREVEVLRRRLLGLPAADPAPVKEVARVHALVEPSPQPRGRKVVVRLYWSPPDQAPVWDQRHVFDTTGGAGSREEEEFLALLRPLRRTAQGQVSYEPEGGTARVALRRMGLAGRLHLAAGENEIVPVRWHDGEAWRFIPTLESRSGGYRASGLFEGPDGQVDLTAARVLGDGFVLALGDAFEVELGRGARQVRRLHEAGGELWLDATQARDWVLRLRLETDWQLDGLPEELVPPVREASLRPQLHVRTAKYKYRGREQLHADLSFQYGTVTVAAAADGDLVRSGLELVARNRAEEEACAELLRLLACRFNPSAAKEELGWKLNPADLDRVVAELVGREWLVTAEGKTYRRPQEKSLCVSSGTDWLEVRGGVTFAGETVPLPTLLAALRRDARAVRLDDGTYGLLPLEWLEQYTVLTELGEVVGDAIHFRLAQAALLDALLRERSVEADAALAESRAALARFAGPVLATAPAGFQGTLREYQRTGLGWLQGLRDLGLGGCLADDMGLGKTVQVLALLASGRGSACGPSLVVAPKSLVFNWEAEARRFVPGLRVRTHVGTGRARQGTDFAGADLFLTTYGTLRQDVELLATVAFDYVILDESQAIKNADTTTAKCARALRARQRLAMTGTPVENRIQDLFSQFEFLNPGLFGDGRFLNRVTGNGSLSAADAAAIGRALRPLILRRTKAQVVKELPPKTEQTLFCELGEEQRREYDRLRDFYRQRMAGDTKTGQMDVLEALLRLRQVACHAGLVSPVGDAIPSAKLDLLLEELETLREEGRKALVFSQFTTLLRRVEAELQSRGIGYCYLDGGTRDRGEVVRLFQEDPAVGVFLISLKAGGVGLNLTAADTVFLLDPWWNPAAEAQAIDRTYRIGQDQPVFAYRLIAQDTVEEKVLALQSRKRELAEAVVGPGDGFAAALTAEDLRFLLG